jgi:hypothetical protein
MNRALSTTLPGFALVVALAFLVMAVVLPLYRSDKGFIPSSHNLYCANKFRRLTRKVVQPPSFLAKAVATVSVRNSFRTGCPGRSYLNNSGHLSEKEQAVIGPIAVK